MKKGNKTKTRNGLENCFIAELLRLAVPLGEQNTTNMQLDL